jgi:GTPase SAR1 family protein
MDYDDFDYKFKVVFTGEMGVGKTRLIQRYCRKMFNEEQEMPATIGNYKCSYICIHLHISIEMNSISLS